MSKLYIVKIAENERRMIVLADSSYEIRHITSRGDIEAVIPIPRDQDISFRRMTGNGHEESLAMRLILKAYLAGKVAEKA